jgi:hypothetical protein
MARCTNCGRQVDVEFSSRGSMSIDGDYTCSDSCKRSSYAKTLHSAGLPYEEDDITNSSHERCGYDP